MSRRYLIAFLLGLSGFSIGMFLSSKFYSWNWVNSHEPFEFCEKDESEDLPPPQKPEPEPKRISQAKFSVRGKVVESKSHSPVSGISVLVDKEMMAETNEEGQFFIEFPMNLMGRAVYFEILDSLYEPISLVKTIYDSADIPITVSKNE